MDRTPEPAPPNPSEEAREYHAMDHSAVNRQFVDDFLVSPSGPQVIDLGSGPAAIPIELCQRGDEYEVLAVDAEVEMLEIAKIEIDVAGMLGRISLQHATVEEMDQFEDAIADSVISNSLLHHLDNPATGLEVAVRLTKPGGRVFFRDLARPETAEQVETLVDLYCGEESEQARQLFRQSLHAALTLDEIRSIAGGLGIGSDHVQMTTDRHWTLDWRRPE